jgi:hypothetical protein
MYSLYSINQFEFVPELWESKPFNAKKHQTQLIYEDKWKDVPAYKLHTIKVWRCIVRVQAKLHTFLTLSVLNRKYLVLANDRRISQYLYSLKGNYSRILTNRKKICVSSPSKISTLPPAGSI